MFEFVSRASHIARKPQITADMVEAMAAAYNAINAIFCHMSRYWRGEYMKAMRYERQKRYDE